MSTKSLWPSFGEIPTVKTPKIILNEQADYLEKMSNQFIAADIVTSSLSPSVNKVSHILRITAESVENYVAMVVMLEHDAIKVYPVTVTSRLKPMAAPVVATNEQELNDALQRVFEEKETVETIKSLLSQSKAIEAYKNK